MNNNVFKSGVVTILFIITFVLFILIDKVELSLICLLLFVISLIILLKNIFTIKKPNGLFNEYVRTIIDNNESILVEIDKFPDLNNKKIYRTKTIDDLLNMETSVKKPIYYITNNDSYDFILLDNKKVYINTIRKNKNIISCLDLYLSDLNNNKKDQYDLIEELDKTTIIKVDKDKEYIVYPLNK
ncbi:MAG: hypothetical protein J5970_04790 [Bacilli bacterium]|nr:hypothetical protein [Bacilli bacterium]